MKNNLIQHLEKLNYFKAVAENSSFYKASLKLGISQPALTRSLQSLEYVLDLKLLTRSTKGVKLTPDGARLLELTREIFLKVEGWESFSKNESPEGLRQLRIGTYDNLATSLLPTLIKSLEKKYPQLEIKLFAGPSNSFLSLELLEKKLDYILIAEPQRQRQISYKPVGEESYGFFASADYIKKCGLRSPLTSSELKTHRLLTIPTAIAGISKSVDRLLWETQISKGVEFNSFEVVKSAMLQGLGIAFMPVLSVWRELKEKQTKQIFISGEAKKNLGRHRMFLCARSDDTDLQYNDLCDHLRLMVSHIQEQN